MPEMDKNSPYLLYLSCPKEVRDYFKLGPPSTYSKSLLSTKPDISVKHIGSYDKDISTILSRKVKKATETLRFDAKMTVLGRLGRKIYMVWHGPHVSYVLRPSEKEGPFFKTAKSHSHDGVIS